MILAFTISSCQPVKMYAGPELPANEVAIIRPGSVGGVPLGFEVDIVIDTVDRTPVENVKYFSPVKVSQIAVKPGRRTIGTKFISHRDLSWSESEYLKPFVLWGLKVASGRSTLSFLALAGHTYVVRAVLNCHYERFAGYTCVVRRDTENGNFVWIEDEATQRVVAGEKPRNR